MAVLGLRQTLVKRYIAKSAGSSAKRVYLSSLHVLFLQ